MRILKLFSALAIGGCAFSATFAGTDDLPVLVDPEIGGVSVENKRTCVDTSKPEVEFLCGPIPDANQVACGTGPCINPNSNGCNTYEDGVVKKKESQIIPKNEGEKTSVRPSATPGQGVEVIFVKTIVCFEYRQCKCEKNLDGIGSSCKANSVEEKGINVYTQSQNLCPPLLEIEAF